MLTSIEYLDERPRLASGQQFTPIQEADNVEIIESRPDQDEHER